MKKRAMINVEDVAKELHKTQQYIRLGLQQNKFPFGTAIRKENGKWTYVIYPNKFLKFIGKEENI